MLWKYSRLHFNDALKYFVVAALGAAVVIVVIQRRDVSVLSGHIGITAYPGGGAVVQVPYRHDADEGTVTISVAGKTVISAMPADAIKYGNDNYFFRPSGVLQELVPVTVSYTTGPTTELIQQTVNVIRIPDSGSSAVADESAPAMAAAAVVSLSKKHNADDKLPAYVSTITDELKGDMHWSATDGVSVENFMAGLNLWARKKDLPFHTEKVSTKTAVLLDAVSRALTVGNTAQVYLQFKHSGRVAGGRMVNVVRVIHAGEDWVIGITDSSGPTGVDVYRVHDGALVDYAFSSDIAVIGWGFIQIWDD